ncbi:hypothetical protein B484DRAFT_219556 [Ochromonadaceae sp. CCMP2298]|nr:hypothetical protein B484DRAFT_219556 [Ochromonadaceae sp. CCMP2298]
MVCLAGVQESITLLVQGGANVNSRQGGDVSSSVSHFDESLTPLMICASQKNEPACLYLLNEHADPWLLGRSSSSSAMRYAEEMAYDQLAEDMDTGLTNYVGNKLVWLFRSLRLVGPQKMGIANAFACHVCHEYGGTECDEADCKRHWHQLCLVLDFDPGNLPTPPGWTCLRCIVTKAHGEYNVAVKLSMPLKCACVCCEQVFTEEDLSGNSTKVCSNSKCLVGRHHHNNTCFRSKTVRK